MYGLLTGLSQLIGLVSLGEIGVWFTYKFITS